MPTGAHGRMSMSRSLSAARDVASLPGWMQLLVTLAVAGAIVLIAHFAGVPGRWAPLVIGGALGLMTALVAGAPRREDRER
jgi:hypothetical protein